MMWQPIETAPKDGTEVDVWVITPSDPMRYSDAWFENGLWWHTYGDEWFSLPDGSVTHWQPLPEPPQT